MSCNCTIFDDVVRLEFVLYQNHKSMKMIATTPPALRHGDHHCVYTACLYASIHTGLFTSYREPGRGWDAGSTTEDGRWHGAVLGSAQGETNFPVAGWLMLDIFQNQRTDLAGRPEIE